MTVTGEVSLEEKEVLVLTVTDNGSGIEEERLRQIQENLKRDAQYALKSDAHIGLANVDARIRLMYPDGNYGVVIDSQVGVGTTIQIRMEAVKSEV